MLEVVHQQLKEHYYDPTFHGVDVDARYQAYLQRLEQAPNLGEAYRLINDYLAGLGDPQTFFVAPGDAYFHENGYRMAVIGDRCFITEVRPGSDAAKELHPGDQVLSIDGRPVSRRNFGEVKYLLSLVLEPATELALLSPTGTPRVVRVATARKINPELSSGPLGPDVSSPGLADRAEDLLAQRAREYGDLVVWKMRFFLTSTVTIDRMVKFARKHKVLILDLRGNPGGGVGALKFFQGSLFDYEAMLGRLEYNIHSEDLLMYMVGSLFDQDVKLGRRVSRGREQVLVAKTKGRRAFGGQLFVLVDGGTATDAELFARIIQSEHRGTIVGDVTAGSIGLSRCWPTYPESSICVSLIEPSVIMEGSKGLNGVGVTPDVMILPTADDLAAGRDPVLARAAELAGVKLDPTAAGKMFPLAWSPF